ncbi:hypothetical protein LDENG_00299340 [Lucifuga dentata]|nr:hypothetical protein LDENG_00299340 [Lucifuga dentata]
MNLSYLVACGLMVTLLSVRMGAKPLSQAQQKSLKSLLGEELAEFLESEERERRLDARDVGSSTERSARTKKTQIGKQESGFRGKEWLLRTQDGQDRNHQWHGLLGLEHRCADLWTMGLDNKGSVCSHLRKKINSPSDGFSVRKVTMTSINKD